MNNFKIGYFLAIRQLFRGIYVVVFGNCGYGVYFFLNLVAVSGILVGLIIEGSSVAYRAKVYWRLSHFPTGQQKGGARHGTNTLAIRN